MPAGAPEMTGVLLLVVSLLLHPVRIRPQRRMLPQRSTVSAFLVLVMFLFLREPFTGNAILSLNPLAEIDKLAPFSTEGTKRIIFPLGWLTTGWAFHESLKPRNGPQRIKEMRVA